MQKLVNHVMQKIILLQQRQIKYRLLIKEVVKHICIIKEKVIHVGY